MRSADLVPFSNVALAYILLLLIDVDVIILVPLRRVATSISLSSTTFPTHRSRTKVLYVDRHERSHRHNRHINRRRRWRRDRTRHQLDRRCHAREIRSTSIRICTTVGGFDDVRSLHIVSPALSQNTDIRKTYLLRNAINNSLQVRRRNQRQNTRIHNPQIRRAIDEQVWINNSSKPKRHHRRRAAGMVLGLPFRANILHDLVAARVRGREQLLRSKLRHALCGDEALVERDGFLQDLDVDWVAAVVRVDERRRERLGRGEAEGSAA
jgi:hypothetical protein